MMLKGQDASNIASGNSFSEDGHQGRTLRLPARQPAVRGGVEEGRATSVEDEHETLGLRRPLRRRAAADQRRQLPVPPAHDLEDEDAPSRAARAWRSSSTARRCSPAPPARASPRSAAGSSRTTGSKPSSPCPTSSSTTPASPPTSGSSPTARAPNRKGKVQLDRRPRAVHQDAQEPRREAQGDQRRPDRRHRPPLRRLRTRATGCKIFPNEDFGFLRITVERPLRLRWEVTDDRHRRATADKKLAKLDDDSPRSRSSPTSATTLGSSEHDGEIRRLAKTAMQAGRRSTGKPIENAIVDALAVRDPDAPDRHRQARATPNPTPTCATTRTSRSPSTPSAARATNPTPPNASPPTPTAEPSTSTSTHEVLPYVPDAWVDHAKTKIGYEIPLTRHFYIYTPPRPLDEIDAEIKAPRSRDPGAARRGDRVRFQGVQIRRLFRRGEVSIHGWG